MNPTHPSTAPEWFVQAVQTPCQDHTVTVDGCPIHYREWGEAGKPGLILVHGNGAHAGWWDFIAPFFANNYRVIALDLAGMGDSGHREHYTAESYAGDLVYLAETLGFDRPPLLIGHSFGGRLGHKAVQWYPDTFAGVIMADSPFNPPDVHIDFEGRQGEVKPNRVYPTFEEAKARYRLFPPQPCENGFIVDYVAQGSIKAVDGGWTWKFDSKIWPTFDFRSLVESQPTPGEKILGLIYGEHSALLQRGAVEKYNAELFQRYGFPPPVAIADAYHHLFLDQPLAFVAEVRKALDTFFPAR